MTNPVPGYKVTTPFGKKGSAWSTGEHGGDDWAAPKGTPIVAPWGGKVSGTRIGGSTAGTQWGSAYGNQVVIDFDKLPDGSPGLWGVLAHMSKVDVKVGQRVEMGQKIGEVGTTGNSTGNHCHFEIQPQKSWVKKSYRDPEPWVKAGGTGNTGASDPDGPYVTRDIYTDRLGFGQEDSDTVKELQERLNRIKLEGGKNLPITGNYAEQTDAEVRKWQEQVCRDKPDPAQRSYLGPKQVEAMFPKDVYTIHDKGLPGIASSSSPGGGTTLGQWLAGLGFAVEDDDVPLGRDATWDRVRFIVVHHTASDCGGSEADIAAYVRTGGEYPPLAQITLGQSGTVWMCSAERAPDESSPGRASHAGTGSGFGVPDDRMNEVSLGIECQCDGSHPLSEHPVLYSTLVRLVAALCHRFDVPPEQVIGHKEWSSSGKTDPLDDMAVIRADVAARLSEPPPAPDDPNEYPPDSPGVDTSEAGLWKWFSGKPGGEVKVYPDGDWHHLKGLDEPASGIRGGSEKRMLYLRLEFTKTRKSDRVVEVKFIRANGDATAYDAETYGLVKDSYPMPNVHFEDGDGAGGKWWIKVTGGKDPMTITTRYAKQHTTIAKEI